VETLELLLRTVWLRPYVFVFMITFLAMAVPVWGWRRTLLYTVIGYAVAWACEYSSIHNGFPFGLYEYVSEPTIDKELWVAGVPFMDSLSFVFLNFAGLQMARLALEPIRRGPRGVWDLRWAHPARPSGWRVWILGALLTMGLDWVIDPVALQGHRWFLGDIYNYIHGGEYFGVPLTNFGGWLFVALVVIGIFLLADRWLLRGRSQGAAIRRGWGDWRGYPADALVGAGLFAGVLAFNLGITFAIGETVMGLVGCLWAVGMVGPVVLRVFAGLRSARAPVSQPMATDVEPSREAV
jgi:putative membrane protein